MSKRTLKRTLGIDPGIKGGLALLEGGNLIAAERMPTLLYEGRKILDALKLMGVFQDYEPHLLVIEKAIPMPSQNVIGTFSSALNMGILTAAAQIKGVPVFWVHPKTWKSFYGLGRKKRESLDRACLTFGRKDFVDWDVLANEGIAEAALIALWSVVPGGAWFL